jgi:hypothetical protein
MILRAEEVRAVLDGEKTVLRRQVKPQPDVDKRKHRWAMSLANGVLSWGKAPWRVSDPYNHYAEQSVRCPFGVPDDRLWVRETWQAWTPGLPEYPFEQDLIEGPCGADYPDHNGTPEIEYLADRLDERGEYPWRPSIHMPRWACRLVLEVTDVRVERLQDITEDDAQLEGATRREWGDKRTPYEWTSGWSLDWSRVGRTETTRGGEARVVHPRDICLGSARMSFANRWIARHGQSSWDANPWVWRVAFRRTA